MPEGMDIEIDISIERVSVNGTDIDPTASDHYNDAKNDMERVLENMLIRGDKYSLEVNVVDD